MIRLIFFDGEFPIGFTFSGRGGGKQKPLQFIMEPEILHRGIGDSF